MRPRDLSEFVGQDHLVGERGPLRRSVERGYLGSLLLWGPPGTGKTSLARLLAAEVKARFTTLSAVMSGVADVRAAVAAAREQLTVDGSRTILFIDEIHRFNKAQQDGLLPHVEDGTVTLIGATTENPYFEVNSALLSACGCGASSRCPTRTSRRWFGEPSPTRSAGSRASSGRPAGCISPTRPSTTSSALAGGDARQALNVLEGAVALAEAEEVRDDQGRVSPRLADIEAAAQQKVLAYDRAGDGHYDTVSAFIKSLRGNDPDGALYWLATMIAAGEDPKFIARRLIIAASEDVGNADPRALQVAVAAADALEWIGLPEAQYALAQATIHVASSPKSDSVGRAYGAAMADVMNLGSLPVPAHLRTAGHPAMKQYGDGVGYRNPHEFEGDDISQQYLPDELAERRYYLPSDRGYEATIGSRMAARDEARQAAREAGRQRRKQRANPPIASMSDALRPREEARKRIAATQREDANTETDPT